MYIIVKDVWGDYGDSEEAVVVRNSHGVAEAYRSKNHAERALEEMIKSISIRGEYDIIDNDDYDSVAYSLWDGHEVFYVYELYVDNRLQNPTFTE